MEIKRSLVTLGVILLLAIGVGACTRSRAGGDVRTPSPTLEGGTPGGTLDVMKQLELFTTQTAMARGQTGQTPVPGAETPVGTPAAPGEATPAAPGEATPAAPGEATPVTGPAEAPTATMVPFSTATPGIPRNYTLQGGEFPFCIARRFNVNPSELLNLNGLGPNSTVFPGLTLRIPQTGNPFPGDRSLRNHPGTYSVSGNETIYEIACMFGDVDPITIAQANGLQPPYRLTSGQRLQIP